MRPQGLLAELLMASSEQSSAALARSLSGEQGAEVLRAFSLEQGALRFMGEPLKSSWRLSGVLLLMRSWPGLAQIQRLAMRAEPDWAPDFGILAAMTSLVDLRLSLSRRGVPPLPPSLRSLRLDLPGDLELAHPALQTLHLYGADHSVLSAWRLPNLQELCLEQLRFLKSVETLPASLRRLRLVDLPQLGSLPELPKELSLQTVRCPLLQTP